MANTQWIGWLIVAAVFILIVAVTYGLRAKIKRAFPDSAYPIRVLGAPSPVASWIYRLVRAFPRQFSLWMTWLKHFIRRVSTQTRQILGVSWNMLRVCLKYISRRIRLTFLRRTRKKEAESEHSSRQPDPSETVNLAVLQQKLQEMQARIDLLESELNQFRDVNPPARPNLRILIRLFVIVFLAVLSPALVVADRWFNLLSIDVLKEDWCQSSYLCGTMLPSYFLIIFVCVAVLWLMMFFQRQEPVVVIENRILPLEYTPVDPDQAKLGMQFMLGAALGLVWVVGSSLSKNEYPGWNLVFVWLVFLTGCFLRAFRLDLIVDLCKRNSEFWISILLAHAAIVAILIGYFDRPQFLGLTLVLFILAMANLWRFRQRVPLIFWIVSLALIVYTIEINGWWTSAVGDEYSFSEIARQLAEKTSFVELDKLLFRANGAHGAHPYFSSFLQSTSIKLFGYEGFGWRFSNPYLCSWAVGLFYLFCKTFVSKRVALIAAFLLAVSSYVMSFSKIGYNNLQALFALTLGLALATWALRSKLILAFACLGSGLALCFYVYPAALYVAPLPCLLLVLYDPPLTRAAIRRWATMLIVFAAMIFPLMLQPTYWETKVAGTFFNQPALLQSFYSIMIHILTNFLYSAFSFLYVAQESHFIASSYLDPLSAGLFLIGFCLLIYQLRRQRFAIFIFMSFVFLLWSVGISHDRATPPNTRMFLFLPWMALIAAWGMIWIEERTRQAFSIRVGASFALIPILLTTITGVNLYQAYPLSHTRSTNMQLTEALFVRISQHVYEAEPNTPKNYAVIVNETWGIEGLLFLQNAYSHLAWARIVQIRIAEPVLSESDQRLLAERNTIIILAPQLDPIWAKTLDTPLRELGKEPCDIATENQEKRFVLYHAPDLPQACYP
jgi:hypothetical protein